MMNNEVHDGNAKAVSLKPLPSSKVMEHLHIFMLLSSMFYTLKWTINLLQSLNSSIKFKIYVYIK